MKTLSYVYGAEQEIKSGTELYFGQLWDGNGDGKELLESGAIGIWDNDLKEDVIVDFEILEPNEDILQTLVKVTSII